MKSAIVPVSRYFVSQRTRLHYLEWGNPNRPTLLLVHGGRDTARTWDSLAARLCETYYVIAPDLRGHGDSEWSSDGGYSLVSYVADIVELVDQVVKRPVSIIGHSLGATISLRYAGIYPEMVDRLVAIEGTGSRSPRNKRPIAPPIETRWRNWIEARRAVEDEPVLFGSVDEVVKRMQLVNQDPDISRLRRLAEHAVKPGPDGTVQWKHDPMLRYHLPDPAVNEESYRLWGLIDCPVLLVWGLKGWGKDPGTDGSLERFRNARAVAFDAGHWVHHECEDAFAERVETFLATGD